jgi:hypothetical protein
MPVVDMPSTKYFWQLKKMIRLGMSDSTDMANREPQEESPEESINKRNMESCKV